MLVLLKPLLWRFLEELHWSVLNNMSCPVIAALSRTLGVMTKNTAVMVAVLEMSLLGEKGFSLSALHIPLCSE